MNWVGMGIIWLCTIHFARQMFCPKIPIYNLLGEKVGFWNLSYFNMTEYLVVKLG